MCHVFKYLLGQDRKPLTDMPEVSETLEAQAAQSLRRLKAVEPEEVDLLEVLCFNVHKTSLVTCPQFRFCWSLC